jgi:hypothetical protein
MVCVAHRDGNSGHESGSPVGFRPDRYGYNFAPTDLTHTPVKCWVRCGFRFHPSGPRNNEIFGPFQASAWPIIVK